MCPLLSFSGNRACRLISVLLLVLPRVHNLTATTLAMQRRYMGAPTGVDVEAMRAENEQLRKEREELRSTIEELNGRLQEQATDE